MPLKKDLVQIIHGIALGDLHIQTQTKGRSFRLCFEQGANHKEYLFHLYALFKEYVYTPPKQKINGNWVFRTRADPSFKFFGQQYYTQDGTKKVPRLIHRFMTPISLAYWYMDDGSIKSKQSKGVFLNTQNFSYKEVSTLCRILKDKFSLEAKPRAVYESKKKTGVKDFRSRKILYYQLYISGKSFDLLSSLIHDHLLPEMYYKFPTRRRHKGLRKV